MPYFRRIRAFLNHLTCVKFCYCFFIRFLSFLARHCRSVWMLCPNPIFAISPVPVGIGTILPSMVIFAGMYMFCYNWTDSTYQLVSPRKNATRCKGSNFSISKSSSLLGFQVHILPHKYMHVHTHRLTYGSSLESRPRPFWLWNSGHHWVPIGFFLDAEGLHQSSSFIFIFGVLQLSEKN